MKKSSKILALLLVFVIMVPTMLLLSGCKKDEGNKPDTVIGTYQIETITFAAEGGEATTLTRENYNAFVDEQNNSVGSTAEDEGGSNRTISAEEMMKNVIMEMVGYMFSATLDVKEDGTFTMTYTEFMGETEESQKGTWTRDGETLTINFEGDPETMTFKDGKITYANSEDGEIITFVFAKKA